MTEISVHSAPRPGSKWLALAVLVVALPAALAVAIGLTTAAGVRLFAYVEHAYPAATARAIELLLHWLGR